MLRFEDIKQGMQLEGVESGQCVEVVAIIPVGSQAATLVYKKVDGSFQDRLLNREHEAQLSIAKANRPWSFDASAHDFKMAAEAYRIKQAYLFDPMMAVHTSNVQPLPHQITAVYESMLPRQPLRFVLADDPGAGKTIMAGLLIRELVMRSDAKRILIVSPGSLSEQWRDELFSKFGLTFEVFSRSMLDTSTSGNPFEDHDFLIARLDQLARAEDLQEKILHTSWDLIVVDEAHKLSATAFGKKINETQRFKLGKLLGQHTRHFLLMTATPHNGKEEDFQLFLSLLDPDRFLGRFRDGKTAKVDVSDIMRRMVKEELLKFDGSHLFPERIAYALNYQLSPLEQSLYENVTSYVREEMGKADMLDSKHKGRVGFALTGLQRRLASSPEAIYQTLQRRKKRLEDRLNELKAKKDTLVSLLPSTAFMPEDIWDSQEELDASEFEQVEESFVDQATASRTAAELQNEIFELEKLEQQAREVVQSGKDRKWDELSRLLQENEQMHDAEGNQRKLIIFTEYRDTLNYLENRIIDLLGSPDAVVTIHGGVNREARQDVQNRFRNDKLVKVLIATDAAGEGVNLQNANLMVNYDLPWNPNRLEQRFGRIHRIGQLQTCHLWNMIASGTREGDVFQRLFEKLEVERKALGGRVFDILGEVFEEKSLKDLLIEAIRYGEQPERMAYLKDKVEGALDPEHLKGILSRNALCSEVMSEEQLFAVKEEMDKAEARKLQPHYMRSFFLEAMREVKATIHQKESRRYEITHLPESVRAFAKAHLQKNNKLLQRYQRICFEKEQIQLADRPTLPMAELMHPGHPLMQTILDMKLENGRGLLKQGTIFLDTVSEECEPRVLFLINHTIREEKNPDVLVSQRIQFVEILESGEARDAGWAPYLSYEEFPEEQKGKIAALLDSPWISRNLETQAVGYAAEQLVPQHFSEVSSRRIAQADKIKEAVRVRLAKETQYQQELLLKYMEQQKAGKDMALKISEQHREINKLKERRNIREEELENMKRLISSTPIVIGGALVIPAGYLAESNSEECRVKWSADAKARKRIEMLAMDAVIKAEEANGYRCFDVSAQNCGWDITSIPPKDSGLPDRHIEVKGRVAGQPTITVTHNEIKSALNQKEKFWLAVVFVDGEKVDGPHYVHQPFKDEPPLGSASVNFYISELLKR